MELLINVMFLILYNFWISTFGKSGQLGELITNVWFGKSMHEQKIHLKRKVD